MRDNRTYSSAYYEQQLNQYRNQLTTETDVNNKLRLQRWIATTQQYLNDAKEQGL
jgi:hypothetical protein